MVFFPKNIESYFPNLLIISIDNCGLTEIHQEDLKAFVYLQKVVIRQNLLEEIEENLFVFNKNLKEINLSDNRLKFIDSKVLDGLSSLSEVFLSKNACIDSGARNAYDIKEILMKVVEKNCSNGDKKMETLRSEVNLIKEQLGNISKTINVEKSLISTSDEYSKVLNNKIEEIGEKIKEIDAKINSQPHMEQHATPSNELSSKDTAYISVIVIQFILIISIIFAFYSLYKKSLENQVEEDFSDVRASGIYQVFTLPHEKSTYDTLHYNQQTMESSVKYAKMEEQTIV